MAFRELTKEQYGIIERAFAKAKSSMQVPVSGRRKEIEYQGFKVIAVNQGASIEICVSHKLGSMEMVVLKVYYKGHTATAKDEKEALQRALQSASKKVYQRAKELNFGLF